MSHEAILDDVPGVGALIGLIQSRPSLPRRLQRQGAFSRALTDYEAATPDVRMIAAVAAMAIL